MTELISIERIRREAREAAQRYTSVNDACPYPFSTDAAHAFKAEFQAARLQIELAQADLEDEDQDDSPFCVCNAEPTISEMEDGQCDACGKGLAP